MLRVTSVAKIYKTTFWNIAVIVMLQTESSGHGKVFKKLKHCSIIIGCWDVHWFIYLQNAHSVPHDLLSSCVPPSSHAKRCCIYPASIMCHQRSHSHNAIYRSHWMCNRAIRYCMVYHIIICWGKGPGSLKPPPAHEPWRSITRECIRTFFFVHKMTVDGG